MQRDREGNQPRDAEGEIRRTVAAKSNRSKYGELSVCRDLLKCLPT